MPVGRDDEYEVVIVRYGTRQGRRSEVYLNHAVYGEADAPIGMDYFFWIVRNDVRTICVDTGFSPAGGAHRRRTFLLDPAAAYDALGVDRAAGPDVVVTHAHYDHIGNLDLFPSSRVVMARAEYEFWTGPHGSRTQFHHSVEDAELATLAAAHAEGRIDLFDDRHELAPGVELLRVGGHTPGQTVVRVRTAAGTVLLASDAIHYYEEHERDMPFAFVADLVGMYEGFDTIRSMVDQGEVTHLVSGHDPDTLDRFPRLDLLDGNVAVIGGTQATVC
jgi:glyoxylase-like metal-dependent hydrolase (beta-lactamase superfamily II)